MDVFRLADPNFLNRNVFGFVLEENATSTLSPTAFTVTTSTMMPFITKQIMNTMKSVTSGPPVFLGLDEGSWFLVLAIVTAIMAAVVGVCFLCSLCFDTDMSETAVPPVIVATTMNAGSSPSGAHDAPPVTETVVEREQFVLEMPPSPAAAQQPGPSTRPSHSHHSKRTHPHASSRRLRHEEEEPKRRVTFEGVDESPMHESNDTTPEDFHHMPGVGHGDRE